MIDWADFHFLRPAWLLALLPLTALVLGLWRAQKNDSQWQRWIDRSLLVHLLDDKQQKSNRWPLVALALLWLLATLAMAGPTWEKLPQPLVQKEQSLVVLWDLSPSMQARDLKPSRLVRARYKLMDLLKAKREGEAALVVYGGEAYVVTPLTDDMETIISQLPALEPSLMPVSGSNTEMAVETAIQLLADANVFSGDILLITDGVVPAAANTIKQLLSSTNHRLSVLAVGTEAGAPIPFGDGFAKTDDGTVIVDKVATAPLKQLASANQGLFSTLRADNLDVEYLLQQRLSDATAPIFNNDEDGQQSFDQWLERGPFIALLLLPFVAFAFRRGWLLPCFFLATTSLSFAPEAQSLEWNDLWQTQDEQAYELLQQGQAEAAAEKFADPRWRAGAQYRSGNYEQAAAAFAGSSATDLYNQATALAQAGKLQESLALYDQALQQQPDFEDAQYNRDIVKQQLEQQQQNQQGGNDQQSGEDQQQNSDQQPDSQGQNQDQNGNDDQQQSAQSANNQDGNQSDQQDQQNASDNNNDQQAKQQKEQQQQAEDQSAQPGEENQNPYQDLQPEQNAQSQPAQEGQQSAALEGELSEEQQQALEQWLKQIPDDPSGLLKRKFQHQYRQRRQEYRTGQWELPSNNAASRL